MKTTIRRACAALVVTAMSAGVMSAQSSLPAPGSGGSFNPAPANGIGWNPGPRPGMGNPGPPPPSGWGSPWYSPSSIVVNANFGSGESDWQNGGNMTVIACGYDAQGVWRSLPLYVSYQWNGVQYDVTVINAWDPWTDMWNQGVDMPAYNTSYYINGVTYNFYAPLSTGTYYFNL